MLECAGLTKLFLSTFNRFTRQAAQCKPHWSALFPQASEQADSDHGYFRCTAPVLPRPTDFDQKSPRADQLTGSRSRPSVGMDGARRPPQNEENLNPRAAESWEL